MIDTSHLDALEYRLSNERCRLASAKTSKEIEFRKHEIAMCEKEIVGEYAFIGLAPRLPEMTIEEILAELEA